MTEGLDDKSLKFAAAKKRLASHPDTSPESLDKLAQKDSPELLERVAENAHTTTETLEKLATHEEPDVRGAVTENKNTPDEILHVLAADENPDVRFRLAENPQTPVVVLETLVNDDNPYVVDRAQNTLSKLKSVSEQADDMLLQEQFPQAESLYRKLVTGLEELLGGQHQEMAGALHKLAASLVGQGKSAEAKSIEERANLVSALHEDKEDKS
jgi:hypothetical protein